MGQRDGTFLWSILKKWKQAAIRRSVVDDAEEPNSVISTADKETLLLARNPGEFQPTLEKEQNIITEVLYNGS